MNSSLVSIIIPLYNHEKYIGETIESALNQTYKKFELIIINDGSTDNSEAIVKQYNDPRLKYYSQTNHGAHATINRGISLAKGDFISILNSDDFYNKTRIEYFVNEFTINPELMVGFSNVKFIKNDKIILTTDGSKHIWKSSQTHNSYKEDNDFLLDLLHGNFLSTTSNLFCRKVVFDKIGLFRNYRYAHDYDFFMKIGLNYRGKIVTINEPLLTYRVHDDNTIHEDFLRPIYETCIVLARFLNSTPFESIIQKEQVSSIDIEKFFNSIVTMDAAKIFLTFLATTRNWDETDFECVANDVNSDLYKSMVSYKEFKSSLELPTK